MKAVRIHEDGGSDVLRYEDVDDPVAGAGRGARFAQSSRAEPPRRVGTQGPPLGSEATDPRRGRRRRGRGARRRRRRLRRRSTRRREPGHPAQRTDHGDRRAHRRHVLRAQGDSRCPAVSARRRALVRGGSCVPAHLRDRVPHARHEGGSAGGRVGSHLGYRRRGRARSFRDRASTRRAHDRHVVERGRSSRRRAPSARIWPSIMEMPTSFRP